MMRFGKPSIAIDILLLFEDLLEPSTKCKRGVSWKSSTQLYYMKRLAWISRAKNSLDNGTYKPKKQYEFTIHERGKLRLIKASHISDRVIQKAFNEKILKPALYPRLIYDNSASQKGKGTDFCLNRLKCHLQRHYRKYGNNGYALLIDFSNYFGNVDKSILIEKVSRYITGDDLELFKTMQNDGEGLGLGSEVNQTSAIFYANDLDHFIKEKLRIKGYCRYMDDLILIHPNRRYLEYCLKEIAKICSTLKIVVNPKKCKIVNLKTDCFTYLKKRIRLTDSGKVIMRPINANIKARKRRIKRQKELLDSGKMTMGSIMQSYISWRGYTTKYDIKHKTLKEIDNLFEENFGEDALNAVLIKFKKG